MRLTTREPQHFGRHLRFSSEDRLAKGAKTELRFPAKDTLPSLFSETKGVYSTQTKAAIDSTVGGEYRGYYYTGGVHT